MNASESSTPPSLRARAPTRTTSQLVGAVLDGAPVAPGIAEPVDELRAGIGVAQQLAVEVVLLVDECHQLVDVGREHVHGALDVRRDG